MFFAAKAVERKARGRGRRADMDRARQESIEQPGRKASNSPAEKYRTARQKSIEQPGRKVSNRPSGTALSRPRALREGIEQGRWEGVEQA